VGPGVAIGSPAVMGSESAGLAGDGVGTGEGTGAGDATGAGAGAG
jgi:hypothetical protein